MTRKARDRIAEGLIEAIAVARGKAEPARLHVPAELDVKGIRAKTGRSQETFAYAFGFTVEQIRAWEQGRSRPLGGVRAYLMMIGADAAGVARLLETTRKGVAA